MIEENLFEKCARNRHTVESIMRALFDCLHLIPNVNRIHFSSMV